MAMDDEPTHIVRLVADADGSSEFVDAELAMSSVDFAPPAAPLDVSEVMAASGVIFWRAPAGWDGRQHPSPARQWVFVIEGAIEIEAGSGTTRTLGPGSGVLLEDTSGVGHTTRVVGGQPATGFFVQAPE